jgi:acetoacetate decarboxylase
VSPIDLEFIICHASEKQLTQKQIVEAQHYAKDLKYPRGFLVYEGDEEYDLLYCLPDNKEIDVCREMMDNMGYPKLELRLSLMSKDHLVDCLAYNSLKVCAYSFLRALDNHFE